MNRRAVVPVLALLAGACARYRPAPLVPERAAAAYATRTLADRGLDSALGTAGAGSEAWDARRLALAAWYFRPELAVARRAWREAQAGERTAGARPQPGVTAGVERATDTGPFEAPWTVSLGAVLRVELGGKRGARLAIARARTLAAELALRQVAQRLALEVRSALVAVAQADSATAGWTARARAARALLDATQARVAEGALARADAEQAAAELARAERELAAVQGAGAEARAALARAIGLPPEALRGQPLVLGEAGGCRPATAPGLDSLRVAALRSRYELGSALAAYAGAEGRLRLAVAEARPDLELAPGYAWDQGLHRWILGLALPALPLNRNRGPIAEAEAARARAAAEVEAVQQALLGEVETAWVACGAAEGEVAAASRLVEALAAREATERAAWARGEVSAVQGFALRLAGAEAEASRRDALLREAVAAARLAAAAGRGTDAAALGADPLTFPSATGLAGEEAR